MSSAMPVPGLHLIRRGLELRSGAGELVGTVNRRPLSPFGEIRRWTDGKGAGSVKDMVATLDVRHSDGSAWFVFDKPKRSKEATVVLADGTPVGVIRSLLRWYHLNASFTRRYALIPATGPELLAVRPLSEQEYAITGPGGERMGGVTERLDTVLGWGGTPFGSTVEIWDELKLNDVGLPQTVQVLCIAFLCGYHCFDPRKSGYPPK
ncbi:hypothetical protein [Thermomonospora curvata]|uniref:Uncharacterized protein n=1 Tax=Thermomonospora curvata (strain ATCC 19995 / DSM 43183 / JCM 3096 / KCTC 9072 / NBRC 15933 / NCIMB 10081 / Henssen B9) TaxID=471852 RepID=D1A4G6_THECD|nr:hypothetical protein [Thermomonospora curvata]ACY96201.1 hypothetical protein Tcur_0606 [Thermomonospora curvata DSM 43183]